MTTISATTVLRSSNTTRTGTVLSTLLLRYPRWIHAEFMTHRVFSRNAASSRAIPVKRLVDDVLSDPAIPLFWGKNQRGMQADEECNATVNDSSTNLLRTREEAWLAAMYSAIKWAQEFDAAGYHKQIVNRLLEPFMHITVLVSATEWENFLELRDHKDAEPHIQMLAREIKKCLDNDPVQLLEPGQWHLPFVTKNEIKNWFSQDHIKLSVARCASTSYKTVDGFDMTLEKATQMYDKLVTSKPIHASPTEHVAQADNWLGFTDRAWARQDQHGNFKGFRQLRHML